MVFGIGEGKIEIMPEKMNYSYGETVKGKVKLELKAPKKAKELRIMLTGERSAPSLGRRRGTERQTVHSFKLVLDGEKEYSSGEYDFEIKLPAMPTAKRPEGVAGTLTDVAQVLGAVPGPIRWYLDASLSMPMSLDITKRVQINIA